MNDEKKLLYNILKKFNGMGKIEAYDLIHKLETLLFYTSNPINEEELKQIIVSNLSLNHEIDPFHFTMLPNGNSCEFDGFNEWLHIYKENRRIFPNWSILDTYYFKTKYAPIDLKKLTKKRLLMDLKGKPEEEKIIKFLKEYKISKKDVITNRLLILEA
ncbi:hypothetical protein [Aquimarina algiphila]|uniref:hypothetical protein n=1 Tax=Aquimarina algiphila TaxID=2047982 RepID=UPI0024937AA9|nr:hypothetical protein [Aquimarina algiphila]